LDAADQVPADRAPIRGRADSGGPLPDRVAAVVPRGVVLDPHRAHLQLPAADGDPARDRGAGELPRPRVATLAVGADRLDRLPLAELELRLDLPGADQRPAALHLDLGAPPGQ